MPIRKRRRSSELFGMAFLDCICCGFGAMLLLFVITTGRQADTREQQMAEIQEIIGQLEADISNEETRKEELARLVVLKQEELQQVEEDRLERQKMVTTLEERLALVLRETSILEEAIAQLLEEKEAIPTVDEPPPVPIPNVQRRQFVTGLQLQGERVLFLLEASGGMLDETIDGALGWLGLPAEERRQSPKWQRVLRAMEWLVTSMQPPTRYQILVFNEDARPILNTGPGEWLNPADREQTIQVVEALRAIDPRGGANFDRAFRKIGEDYGRVDAITMLVDGLPTSSDSIVIQGPVDQDARIRMFRAALRSLPPQVPVSTILFPFAGDPAAAFLFWQLADRTGGAVISPSPTWPDT